MKKVFKSLRGQPPEAKGVVGLSYLTQALGSPGMHVKWTWMTRTRPGDQATWLNFMDWAGVWLELWGLLPLVVSCLSV